MLSALRILAKIHEQPRGLTAYMVLQTRVDDRPVEGIAVRPVHHLMHQCVTLSALDYGSTLCQVLLLS